MVTRKPAEPLGQDLDPASPEAPGEAPERHAPRNRIDRFLRLVNDRGASDLHFAVGHPPMMRVHGLMEPVRYRNINQLDFESHIREIAPPRIWDIFQAGHDADFAYAVPGLARFRVNLFQQFHGSGAVFRMIPTQLYSLEQLGLPKQIGRLGEISRGLVLVTGPTGSGKSTTLSAILDKINTEKKYHIITLEDPIEFVHAPKRSLITQREIGRHAASFAAALKSAMREDPDLVLVGEMRDLETIQMALTAAESGLLVFGTMHTNSAAKSIDRIINVFPQDEQDGVRSVLAESVRAIVSQQLLRSKAGGRVAAVEILFGSPALGSLIRESKTRQITNYVMMGKSQGMMEMDTTLLDLVRSETVDPLAAYEKAIDKKLFRKKLQSELDIQIGQDEDALDSFLERQHGGG